MDKYLGGDRQSVPIDPEHGSAELKSEGGERRLPNEVDPLRQPSDQGSDGSDQCSSLITSSPTMQRTKLTATGRGDKRSSHKKLRNDQIK